MAKSSVSASNYAWRRKASGHSVTETWQGIAARALVILLTCVQPLFLAPGRYITLSNSKYAFFSICMCVALAATVIIWILRMYKSPKLPPRGKLTPADIAILGFAFVTLISALSSPFAAVGGIWVGLHGRFDGAFTQLFYVAIFLIVSRWYSPKVMDFNFFAFSAIIVATIGILQFFGIDFLRLWPENPSGFSGDENNHIIFLTTLGNVNVVSTYACIVTSFFGLLFVRMKSGWQPLWLIASTLNFWLMEIGGSDSGRVGVAVVTFLAIPFIIENRKTLGRFLIMASLWLAAYSLQFLFFEATILDIRMVGSLVPFAALFAVLLGSGFIITKLGEEIDPSAPVKWKLGVILIAACIVAGLIGIEVMGRPEMNSGRVITEAREILHGNIPDEFGTNRVYIWRNALTAVSRNPIIGSGPDTFPYRFPMEAQGFYGELYDKAHNEYIQILICQGILGLLLYLAFLGAIIRNSIPKAFRNPLVMALMVALVGYCVQAFFNISAPIASQILWVFAGMLANKRVREGLKEISEHVGV